MTSPLRYALCIFLLVATPLSMANAQSGASTTETKKPTSRPKSEVLVVKAGLSQPLLLSGANLAVAYKTDRWVFEYSHGMGLHYDRIGRTDAERNQNLDLYSPWTTGFGIGYRLPWRVDVRVEVKAHRYRVTPPETASFRYSTFSIGPAINYHQPVYNGFGLDLTVRFWPNVATTLEDNQQAYVDPEGERRVHEAHDLGVFPNVSLTYAF